MIRTAHTCLLCLREPCGCSRLNAVSRERSEELERRRRFQECAPPTGAIMPTFTVGDAVVVPCAPATDAQGAYPVVLINGRRYALGADTEGATVAGIDDDPEHDDGPHSAIAVQWLDFEYRVRVREPAAIGAYGLIMMAIARRRGDEVQRAERAVANADVAFGKILQ